MKSCGMETMTSTKRFLIILKHILQVKFHFFTLNHIEPCYPKQLVITYMCVTQGADLEVFNRNAWDINTHASN